MVADKNLFLGLEVDGLLAFKKHIDSVCNRTTKRLNVLRVLSHNGAEPVTLMKLYKIYIRPIIEYGSIAFMSAPKTQLSRLQRIQNDAIRICLKLPRYIRTNLLHEYASIEPIADRLLKLNTSLLNTMRLNNEHIKVLVQNYTLPNDNCYRSPLDHILAR